MHVLDLFQHVFYLLSDSMESAIDFFFIARHNNRDILL